MIQIVQRHFKSLIISTLILSFFVFPMSAFANTYGSGNYGGCNYDTGCSSSSTVSSVSNAITQFFCMDQAPAKSPNLYQINLTDTTAKLFFAPAAGPYDRHYISYGTNTNSEGYGVEFSTDNVDGAIAYTIHDLAPNTKYTFKARGGHGCKPGDWSNTVTVKTQKKGDKRIAQYFPNDRVVYAASTLSTQYVLGADSKKKEKVTDLSNEKPTKVDLNAKAVDIPQQPQQKSWWNNVTGFFSNLFHW